jgi:O-antigen ligase
MLLSLFIEAGVVGVICIIFLILFVVAGVRQMIKEKDLHD